MKRTIAFFLILVLAGVGWYFWNTYHQVPEEAWNHEYSIDLADLPEYSGAPAVSVNEGRPAFAKAETTEFYQTFSELDILMPQLKDFLTDDPKTAKEQLIRCKGILCDILVHQRVSPGNIL